MNPGAAGVARSSIVVLEDDDSVSSLVVAILVRRGYRVRAFPTLAEAAEACALEPPDLLISDVDLPDGNGLTLVASLKAPSIVLSHRGSEDDFSRGFAAGAVDYMPKPFTPDELVARVSQQLARAHASRPAEPVPFEPGSTVFGRYTIVRRLGTGGFGSVYLAHDTAREGALVALKVLRIGDDQVEGRHRFVRETYSLSNIRDPHVVAVHDSGVSGEQLYFAMEYVEGETLLVRCHRAPLTEDEMLAVARGLLRALAALEAASLVHRDVKPSNVLLAGNDVHTPVLIDFGLAKRPVDRGVTAPDLIMCTPGYVAPEVVRGAPPDNRSDLFLLGLTLRYAVVGEEAFPALEGVPLMTAIAQEPVPLPPAGVLSPASLEFLARLLALEPRDRWPDARTALCWIEDLPPSGERELAAASAPQPARDAKTELHAAPERPPAMPARGDVAHYRLVKLLGRGRLGEVWQAEHRLLGRQAALKLVRPDALRDGDTRDGEGALGRFEREARITASLHSPHTAGLYDFGVTAEGSFYYAMELLAGIDLAALVTRFGAVAPARAVHVLRQICGSLAEAHHEGLVHGDLRPTSVYLCRVGLEDDFVKVLDFGLVNHRVDVRADIHALGCIGYWLLSGTAPVQGEPSARLGSTPEPPSARLGRALPAALETVVLACLDADPTRRPSSVVELGQRLAACVAGGTWTQEDAARWWSECLGEPARSSTA